MQSFNSRVSAAIFVAKLSRQMRGGYRRVICNLLRILRSDALNRGPANPFFFGGNELCLEPLATGARGFRPPESGGVNTSQLDRYFVELVA